VERVLSASSWFCSDIFTMAVKHRRSRRRAKKAVHDAAPLNSHCLSCEADLDREHMSKTTFEINSDESSSVQSEGVPVLELARILNLPTPVREPRMSGSEVLQFTCSPKQTSDTCSTRSASPSGPEALQQPTTPSRTVPPFAGWNADSSRWSTNTPTGQCAMHISSPSLSVCSQPEQVQAIPLAHHGCTPFAGYPCQTQPSMNHPASHQLYGSNRQHPSQLVIEPSCSIGHNMPIISNFTTQQVPNPWSMWDNSPLSPGGTRTVCSERGLLAIAMPYAFSLSNAEIVSQLKSAAPSTYED